MYAVRHLAKEKAVQIGVIMYSSKNESWLGLEKYTAFVKLRGMERMGVTDVEWWLGNGLIWSRDSYRIKVGFRKTRKKEGREWY